MKTYKYSRIRIVLLILFLQLILVLFILLISPEDDYSLWSGLVFVTALFIYYGYIEWNTVITINENKITRKTRNKNTSIEFKNIFEVKKYKILNYYIIRDDSNKVIPLDFYIKDLKMLITEIKKKTNKM